MIEDVGQDEEVKRLREADSIKGGFLRTISHELRTPLTVIRGTIPLIKGCGESFNDSSSKMLVKVEQLLKTNVNRLSSVVNTILDVVEIDNGSLRLNCCPIDLNGLIREETDRLADVAERKKIRWAFDLGEELETVPGDRQRLGQALHELFDNAIKFSPPGAPINVRTFRNEGSVSIWIGNYGEPIARKQRDEIFEKFYQVDQSTTRETGGVGLGLYLARNVALLHRGSLEVIDGEKGETVFLLKLPLEQRVFSD
jgi:signal transduction histidine kinase